MKPILPINSLTFGRMGIDGVAPQALTLSLSASIRCFLHVLLKWYVNDRLLHAFTDVYYLYK